MAFDQRSLDDYVDVAERMAEFYTRYPEGSLRAAVPEKPWELAIVTGHKKDGQETTQTFIVYTAVAYRHPEDKAPGVGVAWEVFPGRTPYTLGSELMNAETSAWGRAMAALGIATKRGIASRQEVAGRRAEREDGLPVNRDGSLSRSRTSDEEKAAAGVMTSAQAAEHGKLGPKRAEQRAPAERIEQTPADDEFYDTPASAAFSWQVNESDHDTAGTLTRAQQSAMHAEFGKLGIRDRGERLSVTEALLGLKALGSSSDLSYRQAGDLLERLRAAGEGDPVAAMAVEEARRRQPA